MAQAARLCNRLHNTEVKIGILSVQGEFIEQEQGLTELGADCIQLRKAVDLKETIEGLVLPGGEKPYFGMLPMTVKKNAYGRQLGSFYIEEECKGIGRIPITFIRAPYISCADEDVEILAKVEERIVTVKYKNQLAMAFHPELDSDTQLHRMFIKIVKENL